MQFGEHDFFILWKKVNTICGSKKVEQTVSYTCQHDYLGIKERKWIQDGFIRTDNALKDCVICVLKTEPAKQLIFDIDTNETQFLYCLFAIPQPRVRSQNFVADHAAGAPGILWVIIIPNQSSPQTSSILITISISKTGCIF